MKKVAGSSNVDAVHHNGGTLLTVRFKNGAMHAFKNVLREQYNDLLKSESKGKWVHEHLVKRPYSHPSFKVPQKK